MEPLSAVLRATSAATETPKAPAATAKAGGASFAAEVEKATTKAERGKTQLLQHVEGHKYAKALDGEHEGKYVNRSDNARRGEFFSIVRRDDRVWHVYGEGAERKAFEVGREAAAAAKPATTPKPTQT